MRKNILSFLLILAIFFAILPIHTVSAATDDEELNIYAMYLTPATKGDSVLLESKGHYLLVDLATSDHVPSIIKQLNTLGITHIDVMFSHLHKDHVGGSSTSILSGLRQLASAGISVDTLYLADPALTPLSTNNPRRYSRLQTYISSLPDSQIVYLNVGDHISVGDADGEVVGPLDTNLLSPSMYTGLSYDDQQVRYENNCSLAMVFTCGNTTYFTAGDCYSDESASLVSHYGNALQCDIMKLNHHGIGSGNSADLIKAIQPRYSFITNTGLDETNDTNGKWRVYTALNRAANYGLCYMIGNQKKTLIYHIVNDEITLYKGTTIKSGKKMTGWQYLYGADGYYRDHDMYYLDDDCIPLTGVQKIGNHYFYFQSGGRMEYGTYKSNGNYTGWKTYDGKKRYFRLSSDEKYAYMNHGVGKVGSDYYYFNTKGYMVLPSLPDDIDNNSDVDIDDMIQPTKVGSNYYYIASNGIIDIDTWEELDDTYYYFGKDAKMYRNRVSCIDGELYLFETDGSLVTGDGGTEFYEFKNNTYAVRSDGTLVAGKLGIIDGQKYYFNSSAVMQKNKIIQIGKRKYYANKNGEIVCNKKIRINGKTYYSSKNGVLHTKKPTTKNTKKK